MGKRGWRDEDGKVMSGGKLEPASARRGWSGWLSYVTGGRFTGATPSWSALDTPGAPRPPKGERAGPVTPWQVFFIGLWLLVSQVLVAIVPAVMFGWVAVGPGGQVELETEQLLWTSAAGMLFGTVTVVWWMRWRDVLSWSVGPVSPSWKLAGVGAAVGLGGMVVAQTVAWLVTVVTGEPAEADQVVLDVLDGESVSAIVAAVIAAVVLAPVWEELLFRGLIYRKAARKFGVGVGLAMSGALFTVAHVGEVVAAPLLAALMVLSVVFAVAYEKTGSLVVPVVGHATFNAGTMLLAVAL